VPAARLEDQTEAQDRMKITRSTESRYYYLTDVAVVRVCNLRALIFRVA